MDFQKLFKRSPCYHEMESNGITFVSRLSHENVWDVRVHVAKTSPLSTFMDPHFSVEKFSEKNFQIDHHRDIHIIKLFSLFTVDGEKKVQQLQAFFVSRFQIRIAQASL